MTRLWVKVDSLRAVELYQRGLSLREVGAKLGVHATTVRDALKAHGVTRRPVGDVDGKGGWGAFRRVSRGAS